MTPTNCPVSDSSTSESRPSGRPSLKSHLPVEDERVQTLHFFQKAKAASSNVKAVDATPECKTIGPDGSPKRARPVDPRGVAARPPPEHVPKTTDLLELQAAATSRPFKGRVDCERNDNEVTRHWLTLRFIAVGRRTRSYLRTALNSPFQDWTPASAPTIVPNPGYHFAAGVRSRHGTHVLLGDAPLHPVSKSDAAEASARR